MNDDIQSKTFQQIAEKMASLFLEYGHLISDAGKAAIGLELKKMDAFVLAHMSSPKSTLRAAIDPTVEEEAKRLALSIYALIVRSLPSDAAI